MAPTAPADAAHVAGQLTVRVRVVTGCTTELSGLTPDFATSAGWEKAPRLRVACTAPTSGHVLIAAGAGTSGTLVPLVGSTGDRGFLYPLHEIGSSQAHAARTDHAQRGSRRVDNGAAAGQNPDSRNDPTPAIYIAVHY